MITKTSLSVNLFNLPDYCKGNSFRIYFKNDSSDYLEFPDLFACLISNKISKMKSIDPTIDELAISHQTTIHYLKQIYQEMQNKQKCHNIEIIFQSIQDFKYYMEDIDSQLLPTSINEEEITVSNSVDLLHEYLVFSKFDHENGFYQKVVKFISSNFDDVQNKEKLSVDELELILSNESFQIHSLFEFLVNFIEEKGEKAKCLFGYIEFQNLPVSDIELFLQKVTLDDLNGPIWSKLQNRLLLNFSPSCENNRRYRAGYHLKSFTVNSDKKFSGIIASLNKECGENCSVKGVIDVKCSKIQGNQKATDLTDYNNNGSHYSWIDNQLGGYFEFDFKDKKVVLTDYELQTPNCGKENSYPKNWSVEFTP